MAGSVFAKYPVRSILSNPESGCTCTAWLLNRKADHNWKRKFKSDMQQFAVLESVFNSVLTEQ